MKLAATKSKAGRRAPDRESGVKRPHSKIDRYTVQRMSSLLGIWQFLGCLPILVYGIHPIDCLSLVKHTYCGGDPFSKVDKNSKEWPRPNSKRNFQIKTWVPSHRE